MIGSRRGSMRLLAIPLHTDREQERVEKERLREEKHALRYHEQQSDHSNHLRRAPSIDFRPREPSRPRTGWGRRSVPAYGTLDLPMDGGGIPRKPPDNVVWLPRFEDYGVRRLDGKGLPSGAEESGRVMSRRVELARLL